MTFDEMFEIYKQKEQFFEASIEEAYHIALYVRGACSFNETYFKNSAFLLIRKITNFDNLIQEDVQNRLFENLKSHVEMKYYAHPSNNLLDDIKQLYYLIVGVTDAFSKK